MSEVLQIVANATAAKLLGGSRDTRLQVSEMLSYEVEGADRTEQFKAGRWDGRDSFFGFKDGLFPAGFVYMVSRELMRLGHTVQLRIKEAPPAAGPEIGTVDPMGYGFSPRYDYQPDAVRRLLRHRRMIARVATGGGKSNIAVLAYTTIQRPTLFLTTRGSLMYQMAGHFKKAGYTAGVLGDGVWTPRKGINVGMVQTLAARIAKANPESSPAEQTAHNLRRDRTLALLSYFEFVIGEEAHEAGGNSYYDVMQQCRNAHYRLALTATPFMRADGEANMRLQAAFGSIGVEISEKLLIERGILATPYFKIRETPVPTFLRRKTRWPTCYDIGIVENVARNKEIVSEACRAVGRKLPVMILVQRAKHGNVLQQNLLARGVRALFIHGKHEQIEREKALSDLGAGRLDVLIGSTILDVGVDVPSVGLVIIAGGGKAEVGHRQRIGRGLREKKTGENKVFVLDFADKGNNYLEEHAHTRRMILENTPGFCENILSTGVDFPY